MKDFGHLDRIGSTESYLFGVLGALGRVMLSCIGSRDSPS